MLKQNCAIGSDQRYQLRYFKRNMMWFIGLWILNLICMVAMYVQAGEIAMGFWIGFMCLPIPFFIARNPLCFNAQGVFWKGAVCEQKRLMVIAGFVSWQDIKSLTWQAHEKGGGSAVIRFPRSALRQHIPDDKQLATTRKQDSEIVEVTLALHKLDGDSEAVFREMQQHWQNATPRIERNPA